MRLKVHIAVLVVLILSVCMLTNVSAKGVQAHLWLSIKEGQYLNENPDPWISESYVTTLSNFTLKIENHAPHTNSYTTKLIIAVDSMPVGFSVKVDGNEVTGFTQGTPNYQGFGSHGVYPTYYTEYEIGGINAGDNKTVNINITPSSLKVHFDAVGFDSDGDLILKNPFSHDATHVPEFPTIAIPALISLGIIFLIFRKRRKN